MNCESAHSAKGPSALSDPAAGSRPLPAPARWPGKVRRRRPALAAAALAAIAVSAVTGWAEPGRPPDAAADSAAQCMRVLGVALGVESRVEPGAIAASPQGPASASGDGSEEPSRSLAGFASAVRALGVPAEVTELSLDRLESVGFPVVACITEGDVAERRYVVLWDARDDAVLVADGAARWVPRESLRGVWFLGGVTIGERPFVPPQTAWVLAGFGLAFVAGGAARAVVHRSRPAPAALFAATGAAPGASPRTTPATPARAEPDVAPRTAVRTPPVDTLAHK